MSPDTDFGCRRSTGATSSRALRGTGRSFRKPTRGAAVALQASASIVQGEKRNGGGGAPRDAGAAAGGRRYLLTQLVCAGAGAQSYRGVPAHREDCTERTEWDSLDCKSSGSGWRSGTSLVPKTGRRNCYQHKAFSTAAQPQCSYTSLCTASVYRTSRRGAGGGRAGRKQPRGKGRGARARLDDQLIETVAVPRPRAPDYQLRGAPVVAPTPAGGPRPFSDASAGILLS
ncbi:hypothetical protein EVAR_54499_1 [Eumeta japonica]|uniref:Uncharacterized protein n=1 Tax=Eumeta variegata TaxID=151549 RepID=A0A4C1YGW5_EUMVA|nr:hypothetical protein EVAR_54499_1 [Eumeta japonica]